MDGFAYLTLPDEVVTSLINRRQNKTKQTRDVQSTKATSGKEIKRVYAASPQ
jgi:hypothetical protein